MKVRTVAALALVAVLGIFVTSAGGGTQRSTASITVWLQNDAQTGWPDLVASVNQQFQKQHPGVERQRPVPDVADAPAEVRRDARGRQRT